MVHANLSQLRVSMNDESHFDNPLKFRWECSAGEANKDGATYFYDYNKSRRLRGYNLVQKLFGKTYGTKILGDGRRKKTLRSKKGAPRRKHKGKFHRLGNKVATSTGSQIKKFFKKKKRRRMAKKALHKVGREPFAPIRLVSKPQDTPFAK